MNKTMVRFGLVLGVVSAIGPLSIDMYLPAMPQIAPDLHTNQAHVELSLMAYFIGLTGGQLFYGPLSDRFGRRLPILAGVVIYVIGSILCALAPTAGVLIAGRILGGLGAGAGLVIGSAIIRDLYTGHQAARLQALRVLVLGVSPILAPIFGAAVISVAPWRTIFWIGAAVGLASAGLLFLIPETHVAATRKANRQPGGPLAVYGRLLADRRFMGIALGAALAQAGFIAYIAGSSFVFITVNHLPPWAYSLMFGVYGVSFIGGAQFVPQLMRRFPTENLILTGMSIQAVCGAALALAAVSHHASLVVLCPLLLLFLASSGLIGTPSMVLALREHGTVAGTAAGLLSFLQSGGGAVGSGLVASFANGTAMPMTGVMAACAAGALTMGLFAFSRPPEPTLEIGAPP